MAEVEDFFGIDFELDYLLFGEVEKFEDVGGLYLIYTQKVCLDLGETNKLKSEIESHPNTKKWLEQAGKDEIFVAIHLDPNLRSRLDKEKHLRENLKVLNPKLVALIN